MRAVFESASVEQWRCRRHHFCCHWRSRKPNGVIARPQRLQAGVIASASHWQGGEVFVSVHQASQADVGTGDSTVQ